MRSVIACQGLSIIVMVTFIFLRAHVTSSRTILGSKKLAIAAIYCVTLALLAPYFRDENCDLFVIESDWQIPIIKVTKGVEERFL